MNPAIDVLRTPVVERHFVVVGFQFWMEEFFAVSVYFQCSVDTWLLCSHLETILDNIPAGRILVRADVNAHLPLWFSNERNKKGKIVKELLSS